MLGIALIIYGASLLVKLILTKTNNEKIWTNWVGKYWTLFVLVISTVVYWIISKDIINGLANGIILTGIQASMFKLVNLVISLFNKKKNE